jgi:hypothetical protein
VSVSRSDGCLCADLMGVCSKLALLKCKLHIPLKSFCCALEYDFSKKLYHYHINSMLFLLTREDMYAQDSIDLLTNCGIQFKRHDEYGLDMNEFAELLISSGVVLSDSVRWISFHRYNIM